MQDIFLVIGSCSDTLVLNGSPTNSCLTLECWAPNGVLYLVSVKSVAGNIVELQSIISNGKFETNVPLGSFVVISSDSAAWFVKRYYQGVYNQNIITLMKEFGIEDYQLPLCKR